MGEKVKKLAQLVGGEVIGAEDVIIEGVGGADNAHEGEITFAKNKDFFQQAQKRASAIIVNEELAAKNTKCPMIVVDNPRLAFAKIADKFTPQPYYCPGIDNQAVVDSTAEVGNNVSLHPGVVIAEEAKIGDDVILAPGVYVGSGVEIGSGSILHPQVTVEADCQIGKKVVINAGAVIGSEGYGFEGTGDEYIKVPQFGNVVIEDKVEIGANTTIDRGATGSTVVGAGTKIDNLVHIAHNVKIGVNCLIIAQVGISGSVEVGDEVTLAGKTGVAGHLRIGDNTTVAAASVVTNDIEAGSYVSGYPAHDHRQERRVKAARKKFPELIKRMRKLETEVADLKEQLKEETE